MGFFNEYQDVQYLTIKDIKIGYFVIKNNSSNNYLIWANSNVGTADNVYAKLLNLSSRLEINIVIFDYQGKGHSQGKYNDYNCYATLKAIIKNIKKITNDVTIDKNKLIFCGEGYGVTLIHKYMKRHKYNKCVLINPPDNYLRSRDIKKKKKVHVLSTNTKNIAYNDKKYFKEIKSDDDLVQEIYSFLDHDVNLGI